MLFFVVSEDFFGFSTNCKSLSVSLQRHFEQNTKIFSVWHAVDLIFWSAKSIPSVSEPVLKITETVSIVYETSTFWNHQFLQHALQFGQFRVLFIQLMFQPVHLYQIIVIHFGARHFWHHNFRWRADFIDRFRRTTFVNSTLQGNFGLWWRHQWIVTGFQRYRWFFQVANLGNDFARLVGGKFTVETFQTWAYCIFGWNFDEFRWHTGFGFRMLT